MKLFKPVDKKLAEIGFIRVEDADDEAIVDYRRVNKKNGYTQRLELIYREGGHHIALSYNRELHNRKHVNDTPVGLTMYEMLLCVAKMREIGWTTKKPKRKKA